MQSRDSRFRRMDEQHPYRIRREALGLTLEELAHRIGVSVTTLWRWETRNPPRTRVMIRAWSNALADAERDRKTA